MKAIYFYLLFAIFLCKRTFGQPCIVTNFTNVQNATESCLDIVFVNLTVPGGITLKLNLTDGARVTFKGRTTFEYLQPWKGPLVTINGTRLLIQGDEGHIFDGQGQFYWDNMGDLGVSKPQFFTVQTFYSIMKNINVLNSPHDVLQVTNSDHVTYANWYINDTAGDQNVAPEGKLARNTDGFDVWNSTNVLIKNSVVFNQDDCVAVRCGSNITVQNLECHGTHGLSMSVGFNNASLKKNPLNTLTNVYFSNCSMHGGENIIHIKTHNQGGYGLIENVLYENINATGTVKYGILIEQNYPNHGEPLDNVPIKNLLIRNIHGIVNDNATEVKVVCATNGCANWFWDNIDLTGSKKNNTCNYKPFGSNVCDN